MRRRTSFAMAAVGAVVAVGAGGGTASAAKVTNKNSPTVTQIVVGNNSATAINSANSTQVVGTTTPPGSHGNSATLKNSFYMYQDVGTTPGSNNNSVTASNSAGLSQIVGDTATNAALFGPGLFTLPASNNKLTLNNSAGSGNGCGATSNFFCGQYVAGGNHNELTGSNGVDNTQQVFYFDTTPATSSGANSNELTVTGSNNSQFVTNNTSATPGNTATIGAPGGLGARGERQRARDHRQRQSPRWSRTAAATTSRLAGNTIDEWVTNGSGNKVSVKGNFDLVTITGSSPTMTANNNKVTVQGNGDTVTLNDVSGRTVKIKGNLISCNGSPPPAC